MGNLIDHGPSDSDSVRVGEGTATAHVPVKVYQDIYHQITGRTEKISRRYSDNVHLEFSDIERLHQTMLQLCDVHHVVAQNSAITVFHSKERKEQFTSFERFKFYNASSANPTISVVLKYNFSILPGGGRQPQEYIVSLRLMSRVAGLEQIAEDAPPGIPAIAFMPMVRNTCEVSVEYADYVIARGFLEAFDEWIKGCKSTEDNKWVQFLQKYSDVIPPSAMLGIALGVGIVAFNAIPPISLAAAADPGIWASFAVTFLTGAFVLVYLARAAGRIIENSIDSHVPLSYIALNRGDENLVSRFKTRRSGLLRKTLFGLVLQLAIGVAASKLALLV